MQKLVFRVLNWEDYGIIDEDSDEVNDYEKLQGFVNREYRGWSNNFDDLYKITEKNPWDEFYLKKLNLTSPRKNNYSIEQILIINRKTPEFGDIEYIEAVKAFDYANCIVNLYELNCGDQGSYAIIETLNEKLENICKSIK
ncbi:hypothetical protein J4440_05465 [Candidatus Woesearchaeota archaeon]|nr:hypothetical protein [Candidatus Woesearchaeota archaeon]